MLEHSESDYVQKILLRLCIRKGLGLFISVLSFGNQLSERRDSGLTRLPFLCLSHARNWIPNIMYHGLIDVQ